MLAVNQPSLLLPWPFIAFSVGIMKLGLKVSCMSLFPYLSEAERQGEKPLVSSFSPPEMSLTFPNFPVNSGGEKAPGGKGSPIESDTTKSFLASCESRLRNQSKEIRS